MLLLGVIVLSGDDRGDELVTENRLAGEVLCDPLATDHPTCVHEPSPTSTTIDPDDVVVPTPSTITPTTTTLLATPLHLEGSDSTLRVIADLETAVPIAGQAVRLNVHIAEADGYGASMGVNFGDGHGGGMPDSHVDCSSEGTTTTAPSGTQQETKTTPHSYRVPGKYTVSIRVTTSSCDDRNIVTLLGDVVVAPGVTLTNGPLAPTVVGARQVSTANGSPVKLNVHVRDADGFVTSVTVKWGDGTEETKTYPMSYCIDPKTYFRPSSDAFILEHSYGSGGAHEVEVTVSSSGCSGADPQTTTKVLTVNSQ